MKWSKTIKGGYELVKDGVHALGWKEKGKYWSMVYTFDDNGKFKLIINLPPKQTVIEMKRMIECSKWFKVPQVSASKDTRKVYAPTYKSNADPANMWWANEKY